MKHLNRALRLLPLLLALTSGTVASAQDTPWQPFGELTAGVTKLKTSTLSTYGATLGLRHDDLTLGLRYRYAHSPLKDAEPIHEVSLLLQKNFAVAPRLELFGGVATGFAIQHSQLLYNQPLSGDHTMAFSAEMNVGIRYFVAENVALTFSVGVGTRMSGDDWRKLASQLPYDPRTIPTYTTALGGVTIGIPPRVKKVNLPPQLIVDGSVSILTHYDNKM